MPGETEIAKKLVWHDKHHLQVGDTNFFLTLDWETAETIESTPEEFLLVKNQMLTQTTVEQLPERIDNMIEIGIFKGGSIALYEELYSPKRLVGVDIKPDRVAALDEYLERRSATDRVRLYYGVDQQDRDALDLIVRENFADEPLDLVVDDGSHRYGPTKATLNRFLTLLRPTGIYLIEDWSWAHWVRDRPDSDQYDDEWNPLSKLVSEAVMLAASHPRLLRFVVIDRSRAVLIRGNDEVEPDENFDISEAYRTSIWNFEFAEIESDPQSAQDGEPTTNGSSGKIAPVDVWRSWVPLSIRRKVPSKLGAWAHEHLHH